MKNSIGKNAVILTASQVITLLIAMITTMLLSHFRTLEEYGTYSQLLMATNIVTVIFVIGLPNSINYFLAKTEDNSERQNFLSTYFTLSTLLSVFAGALLIFSTSLIEAYFSNPLIKNFMFFFAIYPWTRVIMSSIDNILIVYQKTSYILFFRISNSSILLLIVIITEVFNLSFYIYMVLYVCVQTTFAISVYFIIRTTAGRIRINIDKKLTKKIFKFSVPIGLATMVGTIGIEIDKLFIGKIYNTEELAIYTNAAKEMPVTIIASSLTAVLMPQLISLLNQKKNEEAVRLWGNATSLSYLFICFFATALFVFAPEIISLFYSDKYLSGVSVFRVYTVVLLLRATYLGIILNSIGKTSLIFYSSLASLVINIILNYTFYKIFGFIGPAISTFVSMLLVGLFQLIATSKSINIKFPKIFPWRELGVITFLNIIMGILFLFIKKLLTFEIYYNQISESMMLGIIWATAYLIITLRFIKKKWASIN